MRRTGGLRTLQLIVVNAEPMARWGRFANCGKIAAVHRSPAFRPMTYAVNDACIKCKFTDCVDVCPVDCFYEGENILVIHPD